ncbi:MAG: ABC transporter substrate-binding protein, partial [Gaiellaceae bacterium]
AVARGARAYLDFVNARGGVHGRTIAYSVVDDGGDPAATLGAVQRLVEQEGVFAVFNSVGTEHSLAVRDYLTAAKVPQLFVASGATTFGRDHKRYPWTIGFRPSYRAEGWIYGRYLARTRPGATVGVLFRNDVDGKELLAGLRRGIAGSRARVVAPQPVEPDAVDVEPQLLRSQAAGADALALFVTSAQAAEAAASASALGWQPPIVLGSGASETGMPAPEGSVSIAYLKSPTDVRWRGDPALRLYRSIMTRYAKGASQRDLRHVYGMAVAYELVRVLKAAGPRPTRGAVLAQTRKLSDASNPFLLPGVVVRTSAADRFPVEQVQLQRWTNGRWQRFGGLWSHHPA